MPKSNNFRLSMLIVLLAATGLVLGYDFYLEKVAAHGTCDRGNFYDCHDKVRHEKAQLSSLSKGIEQIRNFCKGSLQRFCLEENEALLQMRETLSRLEDLYSRFPCSFRVPIQLLIEACQPVPTAKEADKINTIMNTNLDSACLENPSGHSNDADLSCSNAIQFVRTHDMKERILSMTAKGCKVRIISACQDAVTLHLAQNQVDAAAENFKILFLTKYPDTTSVGDNCPVEPRLEALSSREVDAANQELEKKSADVSKVSELARNAFIFNCRSNVARLTYSIGESQSRRLREARSLLERLPDGNKQFLENINLSNLRDDCINRRRLSDPWCLQLFKIKYDYLEPKEVAEKLNSVVHEVKAALVAGDVKRFERHVHPLHGFRIEPVNEDGSQKENSVDGESTSTAGKQTLALSIKTLIRTGAEYFKKGRPEYYDLARTTGGQRLVAIFKIYEGHHAGNFRGLNFEFEKKGGKWYCVSASFPFDYTP